MKFTLLRICAPILLIFCFIFTTQAQDKCGTVGELEKEIALPLGAQPKTDLYVKVRPIIVRPSSGESSGQGVTEEEAIEALQFAIDLYDAQGITIDYECIRYLDDSQLYASAGYANYTRDDSAIEIYLYDHNGTQSSGGEANGTPSTASWCDMVPFKSALAHELGHNIGLHHTFRNSRCMNNNSRGELVDGSNCGDDIAADVGDLVCDTPAVPFDDDDLCGQSATNCRDANNQRYFVPQDKCGNIMSYSNQVGFRTLLTDGQAARVRMQASNSILANATERPLEVSTDVVIDYDKTFNRDITVKNGGVLTLRDKTFQFSQCSGIIVEQGGELIVEDATLTVAVNIIDPPGDYFWNGISGENDRDDGIPLSPARIVIRNSTIEMAEGALKNAPNFSTFEERRFVDIFATNTIFRNNKASVELYMRRDFRRSQNQHRWQREGVSFTGCDFIVDADFPSTVDFDQHISAFNYIDYVNIKGCTFISDLPQDFTGFRSKAAIRSFGVRISVSDNDGVPSSFTGFERAIETRGSPMDYYRPSSFRNSIFTNNVNGIFVLAEPDLQIDRCNFDASFDEDLIGTAVRIDACASPRISDNNFFRATIFDEDEEEVSVEEYTGLSINNCGTNIQIVQNNNFSGNGEGITYGFFNGSGINGITFECNEFINSTYHDIDASSSNGTRSIHGSTDRPTSNIHTRTGTRVDIVNRTGNQWAYYVDQNESDQEPKNVAPVEVSLIDAVTDYSTTCPNGIGPRPQSTGGGPDTPNHTLEELQKELDEYLQNIASTEALILQNGGVVKELDELKAQLGSYRMLKNITIDKILSIYHEEDEMNFDKIRYWLSQKDGYFNRIEIAKTYIVEGNISSAKSEMNLLNVDPDLTDLERTSTVDMIWIMKKMYQIHIDPSQGWDDLSLSDQKNLAKIMEKGNFASATAEGILVTFYDYAPKESKASSQATTAKDFNALSATRLNDDVPFYPSPIGSGQELRLSDDLVKLEKLSYTIYDVQGKTVYSGSINSNSINIDDLKNGYYFIQFLSGGKPHGIYKLLKL